MARHTTRALRVGVLACVVLLLFWVWRFNATSSVIYGETVSQVSPPESEVSPSESEVSPPESEVSPPESEVSPSESKVSPPESEVSPPESKVSPPIVPENGEQQDLPTLVSSEGDAPAFCLAEAEATVCNNASLPELIFVVGVSGSGHDLIKALFSAIDEYEIAEFLPFLHIYEPGNDSDWSKLHYAIIEKDLLRERLQYVVDHLKRAQSDGKRGVVLVANSFPMGKDAGMISTGRPDLINLNKFHCDLYRLKFIVIRHHPLASVVTSVNRYCDASHCNYNKVAAKWPQLNATSLPYTVKARILESELTYMEQQLRRLGCHQLVFLENNRIRNEATRHEQARKLVSFLELRGAEVLNSITSVKLPPPEPALAIPPVCSDCIEKTLYNFFERRQAMWPLLIPQ